MKKFDFTLWSDSAFCFFCLWFLFLCLFRYYKIEMIPAVFLSFAFSGGLSVGIFWWMYGSRQKKFLLQQDKEALQKLSLHLTLSSEAKCKQLLSCFEPSEIPSYYLFTMQPLSADTIALKIKEQNGQDFTVFCNQLSPEAEKLCGDFPIKIIDNKQIYGRLKERNALPQDYICGEHKKPRFLKRLANSFARKNTKAFFTSGFALLFLSFFSFYPVYYLLAGGVLLGLSLFCRIFGER